MVQKFLLLVSLIIVSHVSADDWPTFGGQLRSHTSEEESLRIEWENHEPDILWKQDIGLGYSASSNIKAELIAKGIIMGKIPYVV